MEEKKRKYNRNWGGQKKSRQLTIDVGMAGFLCTCNFKEKECIRDAYRILESFSDDHFDDDDKDKIAKESVEGADKHVDEGKKVEKEEEDISDALNREIEALSAETKKPAGKKKFQYIATGVKNVIFISTTVPEPLELATKILHHLDETKKPQSRHLMRLIPVAVICRANIDDIKGKANDLFNKYFAQEPKTFAIVFNRHYNNSVQRTDVINSLAELIVDKNPGNKANLKNPQIAVVVEIIKGHCLLSIAPDYFKYRKYNLTELCVVKAEAGDSDKAKVEGVGDKVSSKEDNGEDSVIPDVDTSSEIK